MAKYCTNCGHELHETDKFCAECATPVGGSTPVAPPKQWEYCEILFDEGEGHWFRGEHYHAFFYAQGRRDDDIYTIARSGEFKADYEAVQSGLTIYDRSVPPKRSRAAFNELVKLLTDNGWEQMQEKAGSDWWRVKFHRSVKH